LSCLNSTNTLSLEGEEDICSSPSVGFISLLQLLCSIPEAQIISSSYSIPVEAANFILSTCAPYFAHLLHHAGYEQTSLPSVVLLHHLKINHLLHVV
jgi:hypothetical protein